MTCQELVAFLDDYLAGALEPGEDRVFEAHLRECPDCVHFLNSYRRTIELGRHAMASIESSTPVALPARLLTAVLSARKAK